MRTNSLILKKQNSHLLIGIETTNKEKEYFAQTKQSLFFIEQLESFIDSLTRTYSRQGKAVIRRDKEVVVSVKIPLRIVGNKGLDIFKNILDSFLMDLSQGNMSPDIKETIKDISKKMILLLKKEITLQV